MGELSLPPRPDRNGEPRPPHAPRFKYVGQQPDNGRKPEAPYQGDGPVLTWYRETPTDKIMMLVISLALVFGGASLISWFSGDGPFGWADWWVMWVFYGVLALLIAAPMSIETHSAGAYWFNKTTTRLWLWTVGESTVSLYDLTKVDIDINIGEAPLRLESPTGALTIPFEEWQGTRLMWDLVYNGIVHSVANGARISDRAWKWLELDDIQGLAEAAGRTSTT